MKGIDNLCFYGKYPIFGNYAENSRVFFAAWFALNVWLAVAFFFKNDLRDFFREPCALDDAKLVRVWIADEEEQLNAESSALVRGARAVQNWLQGDAPPGHGATVPVLALEAAEAALADPSDLAECGVNLTCDGSCGLGVGLKLSLKGTYERVTRACEDHFAGPPAGRKYVVVEATRYVFDGSRFERARVDVPTRFQGLDALLQRGGLTPSEAADRLVYGGPNAIAFRVDTWLESLTNEFVSVYYLYQLASYLVWFWFSYLVVGCLLGSVVIASAALNIAIARANQRTIAELTKSVGDVDVSTVVFVVVAFQYLSSSAIFSLGSKYRQPIWENKTIVAMWVGFAAFLTFLLLSPQNAVTELFHIASQPFNEEGTASPVWEDYQEKKASRRLEDATLAPTPPPGDAATSPGMSFGLRFELFALVFLGLAVNLAFEKVVIQGPVNVWCRKFFSYDDRAENNVTTILAFAGYRTVLTLETLCPRARRVVRGARVELDVSQETDLTLATMIAMRGELFEARRAGVFKDVEYTFEFNYDDWSHRAADVVYRGDRPLLLSPPPRGAAVDGLRGGADCDKARSACAVAAVDRRRAALLSIGFVSVELGTKSGDGGRGVAISAFALTSLARDAALCFSQTHSVAASTFETFVIRQENKNFKNSNGVWSAALAVLDDLATRRDGEPSDEAGKQRWQAAIQPLLGAERLHTLAVNDEVEFAVGDPDGIPVEDDLEWTRGTIVRIVKHKAVVRVGEDEREVYFGQLRLVEERPCPAVVLLAHAVADHRNGLVRMLMNSERMSLPLSYVVGEPGKAISVRTDKRCTALDHAIVSKNFVAIGMSAPCYAIHRFCWVSQELTSMRDLLG
ncbi:hypothetical protein AURANDRAFT_64821 [Aureococcus anophagefferens]|uniref:Uncharacterized protein n=1 Tax=Aureococcus anophagefferens TaxID=44056 RepID=F0YBV4_AURAN|nr:hypothetical protein AURANDRAFT_64821 [Aureococcus anophagefferens]EGB07501.1 hypothetical protein AURANDRAFT_64821 [Aureococcus anophagefferens]|eukprot:XP_009038113.1 hypothetical protein AURANDRAFT_64821 [Aureococcus anophagefferens]